MAFPWFSRHRGTGKTSGKAVDDTYVSEFEHFMQSYLDEHPEAVEAQKSGWLIYWDKKVDLHAQEAATADQEPDTIYGFHRSPWQNKQTGHPDETGSPPKRSQ